MAEGSMTPVPIRKTKRGRRPQIGVLAALLVLAAAAAWAILRGNGDDGASAGPLRADFETVWRWSDAAYAGGAGGAAWSFRWDGAADLKAANDFASALGFKLSGRLNADGGPVDVVASDPDYKLTLWVRSQPAKDGARQGDPRYDVVLLLDAAGQAERSVIGAGIARVEKAMRAASDLELRGGFTVKGRPAAEGAGARVAKAAEAEETEAYDDGNTSSLTYYSGALGSRVLSGSKPVNLQIAESRGTPRTGAELIIGVPLITGDYTMQAK
ncbi:YwmB family TATA-box binding protein [Paenibacillus sp. MWE-103]|uniref:YwmB family TATA-box binding protein n=1 Tax=Paenibacillus artemisiicola TaxID=1172618 RepID=A0ABS3WF43_9BACL|nr:YwmB family TATA-box binding protein [Paenibacillus artemisiicola]MBO7746933.1 YwmB family TATA-box binding protein [Paenibacillus artemisiicola]